MWRHEIVPENTVPTTIPSEATTAVEDICMLTIQRRHIIQGTSTHDVKLGLLGIPGVDGHREAKVVVQESLAIRRTESHGETPAKTNTKVQHNTTQQHTYFTASSRGDTNQTPRKRKYMVRSTGEIVKSEKKTCSEINDMGSWGGPWNRPREGMYVCTVGGGQRLGDHKPKPLASYPSSHTHKYLLYFGVGSRNKEAPRMILDDNRVWMGSPPSLLVRHLYFVGGDRLDYNKTSKRCVPTAARNSLLPPRPSAAPPPVYPVFPPNTQTPPRPEIVEVVRFLGFLPYLW